MLIGQDDRASRLDLRYKLRTGYDAMKTSTAHARLEKLQLAAEECLTREAAQAILMKADKAHAKLESSAAPLHRRGRRSIL